MKMLKKLFALLFPPKCILCARVLEKDELDLCRRCRTDSPECPVSHNKLPFVDSWIALWYYRGFARKSLLRYKFQGRRCYAPAYGRLLAMKLAENYPEGFDCLTWVPTGAIRKFFRGYDQVELLANAVAPELGMEPLPLLKKIRNNRPQSGIRSDAKRRANVLGAYKAINEARFCGKRVLLLDDIITTGSTVGECARILLTAGAEEVHCAAVASARQAKR